MSDIEYVGLTSELDAAEQRARDTVHAAGIDEETLENALRGSADEFSRFVPDPSNEYDYRPERYAIELIEAVRAIRDELESASDYAERGRIVRFFRLGGDYQFARSGIDFPGVKHQVHRTVAHTGGVKTSETKKADPELKNKYSRIREARDKGVSVANIANKEGISEGRVYQILRET